MAANSAVLDEIWSGFKSNSSEILWLLVLPAIMKKIRLKCRG